MDIICNICQGIIVNQDEKVSVTKCGHIFHHDCLSQWIKRSKSCPQCRSRVTRKQMFRCFPTISDETDDISRIDDIVALQLRQQREANAELRERIKSCEEKLTEHKETINRLKNESLGDSQTLKRKGSDIDKSIAAKRPKPALWSSLQTPENTRRRGNRKLSDQQNSEVTD